MRLSKVFAFAAVAALPLTAARADEGMWTIDGFPTAKMQADYAWAPDQAWLDKVRSAAVRCGRNHGVLPVRGFHLP